MRAASRPKAPGIRTEERFAPKIYYFHPLLAGARSAWTQHLARCQMLGFDHLLSAPLFAPGTTEDLFLTADHERVHPALDPESTADAFIKELAQQCREHDLELMLDIVVGRVAADATVVQAYPQWFRRAPSGPVDPRAARWEADAALGRFEDDAVSQDLVGWWIERLRRLVRAGVAGFRCEDPQLVPAASWRRIIAAVTQDYPHCRFMAWTPGLEWQAIAALRDVGFAGAFSSLAWWDGRASWFVEEHQLLRDFGSVVGCPEALFGTRLAMSLQSSFDPTMQYRHLLRRAAATGDGIMIPMGLEFAASAAMERRSAARGKLDGAAQCDGLLAVVREANKLSDELAGLQVGNDMRTLVEPAQPVTALFRSGTADVADSVSAAVILINTELCEERALPISLDPLPSAVGTAAAVCDVISADRPGGAPLAPGEVRLLDVRLNEPIKLRRTEAYVAKLAALSRIAVDNVTPSVLDGRFAAKRLVGESIPIEADVLTDGHELLAVELLWRAADEKGWRRSVMQPVGNNRWRAALSPSRIGRYEFTIEAWWDRYGTFCRDLELKHKANNDVGVEIVEGRQLLEETFARAKSEEGKIIEAALQWLNDASHESAVDILLAHDLRDVMRETQERPFLYRREPAFGIDVERPQAGFAVWYEMFPRSATDSAKRHGTFDDVIRRLPAIRDMGFDVLYFPPIHPIGVTNRKGKNNSLEVAADDVGSPYAIGGADGGHEAIHHALGTIADFRRLRDAAAAHGIELALDFAIQFSPDHPWLKDHPEWFRWRPDGSLRYAENPPKKYQDIVNVDFYAADAFPALWNALRDIVLYWRGEGVRLFRVDNPHTKPLPFWEWLIAQVRGRFPDVIFLSEAFTEPKLMHRLAMLGFSQSYTYFTWRNTKREITDYFTELTTTAAREYFRPHLFVNTPDINPYFLQTSGRPGFLIRAALAATLSGLWGLYSGFELCEGAPLPGREEYLDSEKYQIRVRRFDEPGNIVAEIAKLNRIRRSHPALQSHLGLRFYPAHDDQVLLYGKMTPDRTDMVLVAVNLDPFHSHEVTIEVPLWEWQLPDSASVAVTDLLNDAAFTWHGKLQRLRLDPLNLPYAIWHIGPKVGG